VCQKENFLFLFLFTLKQRVRKERARAREGYPYTRHHERRERAREKDGLAYWYPDISAVLDGQLVRGHTPGPYKLQVNKLKKQRLAGKL